MESQRWSEIRSLFEASLELAPDRRGAFLAQRCSGDPELRAAVEDLLSADSEPKPTLDDGVSPELVAESGQGMRGTRIGSFEIVRVLGTGGMGTVYEAVQDRPHRVVALKMLRLGLQTEKARRRFEYESEILGRLRHPGIAQVVEAGTYDADGMPQPYFAMEFVEGAEPLDVYARQQGLGLPALLDLFSEICEAVHYGHQRGVIHRDLKPQNILIDGGGRPKIIDFGIARGTGEEVAQPTLLTEPGQVIGTLEYMAPEQLAAEGDAIDTRADVYALGVILFELLTGRTPFQLAEVPLTVAALRVTDEAPPRPSTVAMGRIPPELDWIALRAMEKDPERRYASASELAADLGRYLGGEPVLAGPPSTAYRLRKFVGRHRLAVSAAAFSLLALIAGTVATAIGWNRAVHAERLADARRQQAEEVAHSFWRIDRLQEQVASGERLGLDYQLVELLDQSVARLDKGSIEDPSIQAALRNTLAAAYRAYGKSDRAREQFEVALELVRGDPAPLPEVVPPLFTAAGVLFADLGEFERGEALLREAVDQSVRLHGAASHHAAESRAKLAHMLYERGKYGDAVTEYELAWESSRESQGPGHSETVAAQVGYGNSLQQVGRLEDSETALRAAVQAATEHLGRMSIPALAAKGGLALVLQKQERYGEAEGLFLELVELRTRASGPSHPRTLYQMNNLGVCYNLQSKHAEAEKTFARLIELRQQAGTGNTPFDLKLRYNLAVALHSQGDAAKVERAESVVRALIEDGKEGLPGDHWMNAAFRCRLGICLGLQERYLEAENEMVPGIAALEAALGAGHGQTRHARKALVALYEKWGRDEDAARVRAQLGAGTGAGGEDR